MIKIENFFLIFLTLKKIKKFKKKILLKLYYKKKKINLFIKKKDINICLIGIYGLKIEKKILIFEICYYKNKINKININYCKFKSNIINFIRFFFYKLNFYELDVPIIENFSRLGSKQFLIIDKNKINNFFSLSQSPQYIKQYYIFNNIKKYFKIAKCFRNEENRKNRLKEFNQIDIEISNFNFILIKKIINKLLKMIINYFLKKKIFLLNIKYKYIKKFFFEKKNFRKPYINFKIKIKNKYFYIFKSINIFFIKKYFFYILIKKYIIIISFKKIDFNLCYLFDFYLKYLNIINNKFIFFWYVNFLYYKKKKIKHHQFTSYKNNFKKKINSKSLSYDINLNGTEIGGGSIRNINFNIQKKNFYDIKEYKSFFLNFYKRSISQHCGIAIGLERLISSILKIDIKKTITYNYYYKKIISKNINEFYKN
ncbi:MAG: amino acid--tRNA ligase-related protein [Candidatus Carsonella ruddii]